jgi:glutathione S-transferase
MDSNKTEWNNLKLTYFGINGRAAVIRAILHWANIKFEDKRVSFEEWGGLKKSGKFEFEQLPLLEIDGENFSQMSAINIFLARSLGLLPGNTRDEYLVNSLVATCEDIYPKTRVWMFPLYPGEKEAIEENQKAALETHVPFFLQRWEERFKKYGGKYLVGDNFSLADIFITVFYYKTFFQPSRRNIWEPVVNENAPTLTDHVEKIKSNELANYFNNGGWIEGSPF